MHVVCMAILFMIVQTCRNTQAVNMDEGDGRVICIGRREPSQRERDAKKQLACVALSQRCPFAEHLHVDLYRKTKGGVGERRPQPSLRKKGSVPGRPCVCGGVGRGSWGR